MVGPYWVEYDDVFWLAVSGTLLVLLFRRFQSHRQERHRLANELEAARIVQRLILPGSGIPGVEAVYLPAAEVGGDFWQCYPTGDGGKLIIVGDVSGKGLKAAMVVSLVTGVLQNRHSDEPAAVLGELNRALSGKLDGGFVTCCCALLHPGGNLVIANAGHIAPYIAGDSTPVDGGLPLGIISSAEYTETSCHLGDQQATFVSDGVVEAANTHGELFGFDRTREISTGSASEIAEAARAWGQNDDITVVTVRCTEKIR
jgi:serine phosphatase RsbU (regulator of sigma subunit)